MLFVLQLKGAIFDDNLNLLLEESVEFDSILPEFRTQKGVIHSKDGKTITTPTIMWVKAMDVLLDKLQVIGADFGKLSAVAGSAQVRYDSICICIGIPCV